ncbi:MAG: hypothetical protein Q9162_002258 [Coniocarpon cinnabarinum]
MGACASTPTEDGEAKKRSEAIDRALQEDQKKLRREAKILLLGSGESGKSTVVKQMKIIHQGGYAREELAGYRSVVYRNLLDCAKALLTAMQQFELEPSSDANKEHAQYLMTYDLSPDPYVVLDANVGEAAYALWKDPVVPQVMEHQTEFYLMDSAP